MTGGQTSVTEEIARTSLISSSVPLHPFSFGDISMYGLMPFTRRSAECPCFDLHQSSTTVFESPQERLSPDTMQSSSIHMAGLMVSDGGVVIQCLQRYYCHGLVAGSVECLLCARTHHAIG